MKLRCTIGSIGVVGTKINVKRDDIFEVADSIGKNLIKRGYAVEIVEPPTAAPVPDATPPDSVEEELLADSVEEESLAEPKPTPKPKRSR